MRTRVTIALMMWWIFVGLAGCRTTHITHSGVSSQEEATNETACIKPEKVEYSFSKTALPMGDDYLSRLYNQIEIKVTLADIASGVSTCDAQRCKSVLIKPVKVSATIPTLFNSRIVVDYEQANSTDGNFCVRSLGVSGGARNLCINKILNVSIELELEGKVVTDQAGKNAWSCKISGTADAKCDLPFITLAGRMDDKGIEFSRTLKIPSVNGWDLSKIAGNPEKSYRVEYKDLPEQIESLKKSLFGSAPTERTDIAWGNFAHRCRGLPELLEEPKDWVTPN